MSDKSLQCSFCGRKKEETEILIAGIDAHICDACIEQAAKPQRSVASQLPSNKAAFWAAAILAGDLPDRLECADTCQRLSKDASC